MTKERHLSAPYVDPDVIALENDDQLPLLSCIGRGPAGPGITAKVTDDGRLLIADRETGEVIDESGVLAPKVSMTEDLDDLRITIRDSSGIHVAHVRNGRDGKDGQPGTAGKDGHDGSKLVACTSKVAEQGGHVRANRSAFEPEPSLGDLVVYPTEDGNMGLGQVDGFLQGAVVSCKVLMEFDTTGQAYQQPAVIRDLFEDSSDVEGSKLWQWTFPSTRDAAQFHLHLAVESGYLTQAIQEHGSMTKVASLASGGGWSIENAWISSIRPYSEIRSATLDLTNSLVLCWINFSTNAVYIDGWHPISEDAMLLIDIDGVLRKES